MIVKSNSSNYFVKKEAGGKGYNLYLLTRAGFSVPHWVVLGVSMLRQFIQETNLKPELDELLQSYQNNPLSAAKLSKAMEYAILETPLPESLYDHATQCFNEVATDGLISVRSSADGEDGGAHSFAGQLSSFLYVSNPQDAAYYLKKCWASAYSERSIEYRNKRGISLNDISVAVVFQRMIDADVSGVLFTSEPTDDHARSMVISSVYGAGEGLVSGNLESDTYWLSSENGELIRKEIVEKSKKYVDGESGHCLEKIVPAKLRHVSSLSNKQLGCLYSEGKRLQEFYNSHQDIEWVIKAEQLYILQSRPITTESVQQQGYANLWDNSNIVESYGGITLPLSFTFALQNYKNVYIQFCEILGVPRAVVKDMEHYLAYMLGCIEGRVYYNLYNWYKLVGVLPGFKQNRQFMETMMGVGQSLSEEIKKRIEPHPSWSTFKGKLRRFTTGFKFILFHFRIQSMVDKFLADFYREYAVIRKWNYTNMHELLQAYLDINNRFLIKWKAPIINDFLCMVHFGLLNKLCTRWLGEKNQNVQNDLLSGEGDLESAEPTKMLIRLACYVEQHPKLKQLILNNKDFELLEIINQSEFQVFYNRLLDYIDRFGYRCISEMKLEEKDLLVDPSFMFACLKNYIRSKTNDIQSYEKRETRLRIAAEHTVAKSLQGWKKIVFNWSVKHARKSVRNRENTRFARTRIYGVIRHIFREMGAQLTQLGVLASPQDIFYLELPEIYGIYNGTLTATNLQKIVELRKKEYRRFEENEPKIRFQTRGPVYWKNDYIERPELPQLEEGAEYDLSGIACCPGVVESSIRIIHSVEDNLNLDGEILVARRTDPGWVPIFPSISGLLVERGSMLSHSAIVAREMGIPTVVGINGLLHTLKDGMRVRMDGKTGTIKILD